MGPLTIELAHEMPIFIGHLPIRKSQLPRKLPRRWRPEKGPYAVSYGALQEYLWGRIGQSFGYAVTTRGGDPQADNYAGAEKVCQAI